MIQHEGGTRKTVDAGLAAIAAMKTQIDEAEQVEMSMDELVVGTICGGSDGTSGITANPAVGKCFDRLIQEGATCIFEETGELIGCEQVMMERAATPELAEEIRQCIIKAEHYYRVMGYGSFAPATRKAASPHRKKNPWAHTPNQGRRRSMA